jgi:hypothetical protein
VVGDISAGAVPGHEDSGGGIRQRACRAGEGPPEGCLAVVVGSREAVLGREAVVDGGDDGRDGRRQAAAQRVVLRRRRGVEDEAAAVEVHDHRELVAAAGDLRDEEAGAQVVGDGVVRGCHAAEGGRRGGRRGAVEEGEQEAVDGAVAAERGGVQRGGGAHKQPRAPRQRGLL